MKKLPWLLCLTVLLCACHTSTLQTTVPTQTAPPSTAAPTQAPPPSTAVPPQTTVPEPADDELVAVADYIPDIAVELRYAGTDNFTGQVIYDFQEAYLRYGTVKKLAQVQQALEDYGLGLKIWDAYRPTWAQYRLWEICPDPTFVADPSRGFSNHSRGNTVDVTLVDGQGQELEMPTGFDDFSPLADRDYADCGETARENALLLESTMEQFGFCPYFGEWWHFSDSQSYEVLEAEGNTAAATAPPPG